MNKELKKYLYVCKIVLSIVLHVLCLEKKQKSVFLDTM